MVLIVFLVKEKFYSTVVYLITRALAGFGLAINIYKLSSFKIDEKIYNENEKSFIKWIYFIRIRTEFIVETIVCFTVYSTKKKE